MKFRNLDVYEWILFGFLGFCFLLVFFIIKIAFKPTPYAEYFVNERVVCSSGVKDNCGMSLYNCTDGSEYRCQQNVKAKVYK